MQLSNLDGKGTQVVPAEVEGGQTANALSENLQRPLTPARSPLLTSPNRRARMVRDFQCGC